MIVMRWEHAGMDCLLRHGAFGCPCGYVRVAEGHPLHGRVCWELDEVDVYGGVTWAGTLPEEDGWWVGFDMGHAGDFAFGGRSPLDLIPLRTDGECEKETDRLAEQLAAMRGE